MTPEVMARSEAVYKLADGIAAGTLRPATHTRLRDAMAHWFDPTAPLNAGRRTMLDGVLDVGEGDLAACAEIAELGLCLLAPSSDPSVRVFACKLLTHVPSVQVFEHLAGVLADASAPVQLRGQAAWSLGFRQLQTRHSSLHIEPAAVRIADQALRTAVDAGLCDTLPDLAEVCRHISDPAFHDSLVDRPQLAATMVDGFCSPALAAVLLDQLPALPAARRPYLARVIAATLGRDCVDALLARTADTDVATRQEALLAACSIAPDVAGPALDGYIESLSFPGDVAARRAFVAEYPNRHPLVDVVALGRSSACIPPGERVERFAPLLLILRDAHAAKALEGDALLRASWVYLAFACRDAMPAALADAIAAEPDLADARSNLPSAYLASLASAGHYRTLASEGARLRLRDEAGWHLARHARPFLSLRTTFEAKRPSAVRIAAETVALTLAGRPDLGSRTLTHVEPEAEFLFGSWGRTAFPGEAESFAIATDAPLAGAIAAVVRKDRDALLAQVCPPPEGADRDDIDFQLLRLFETPRGNDLTGARVVIVGGVTSAERTAIADALAQRGAELLDGAFGEIDRFIVGDDPSADILHRLFTASARPLAASELDLPELASSHQDAS